MTCSKICGVPFSEIRLYPHPFDSNKISLMTCCSSWLQAPYNEYTEVIPETPSGYLKILEIWNTQRMIDLRKSVVDGSYRYCKLDKCPNYLTGTLMPLPDRASELIEKGIFELDYPPLNIHACIDKACNLQCPTCRTSPIFLPNKKSYNWLKSVLLSGIETLNLNGSGEIFKNKYILDILSEFKNKDYPNLKRVDIITNGTLINHIMWISLPEDLKRLVNCFTVSVDAASEEVYRIVRPGGNFKKLVSNLSFLGDLRRDGVIINLALAFVVQKSNVHELYDFVKLADSVNANIVTITKVEDWSIYPHDYYLKRFELPTGWEARYKEEFDNIKKYLKDKKIVCYSNVI